MTGTMGATLRRSFPRGMQVQIQGHYELQFEAVREAFAALFDDPQERGAALCVQVGGETVLDLWAGTADKDGAQAWHSDTIANLFSCTKTFTAVTALQLVAEGKLQLDAPVANDWPQFAAAGKDNITLELERNTRTGKHARFLPTVHSDACTGCGKCEKVCVLEQPAIKVLPLSLAKGELGHHYRFGWLEGNNGKS